MNSEQEQKRIHGLRADVSTIFITIATWNKEARMAKQHHPEQDGSSFLRNTLFMVTCNSLASLL
jgi:hypothetical protein